MFDSKYTWFNSKYTTDFKEKDKFFNSLLSK